MKPLFSPILFSLFLALGMLIMVEVGRRLALRRRVGADGDKGTLGTVETAVLALFGLLVAFTFSGASSRFQEKRMLIAEEANAIFTAFMRIDLVPPAAQADLREQFRQYVDSRIEVSRRLPDLEVAGPALATSKRLQGEIWRAAIAACRLPNDDPSGSRLLLPAINDMIGMNTKRMISLQNHPPSIVYVLLFLLGNLCALLAGFRMAGLPHRSLLHMVTFPLVTAAIVYVTIDIEYPRVGLIQLEQADQALMEVRANMD